MYTYANGNVYEGEWKGGAKSGRGRRHLSVGRLCYDDGYEYDGEWADDRMTGKGMWSAG